MEENSLSVKISIPAHNSNLLSNLLFPLILSLPVILIPCATKDAWSHKPNQDLSPNKPVANGPRE